MSGIQNDNAVLVYLGEENISKKIFLPKKDFSIGSSVENDLSLSIGNLSRHHARFCFDKKSNSFEIIDLGSTNGSYLNGKKITPQKKYHISNGDYIQFSQLPFQFIFSQSKETTQIDVDISSNFYERSDYEGDKQDNIVRNFMQDLEEIETKKGIPKIGKSFKGTNSYKVTKSIGQGGMGSIFKAVRLKDHKDVVLKFLDPAELQNPKSLLRFITEAKLLMELEHENIVKASDIYQDLNYCFFVMDYVEGPSIQDMLDDTGKISVKLSTEIVFQISKALAYLEDKKIFHRDIKPANIIWNKNKAILVDFGIVKALNIGLTTEGYVLGTMYYISPEQVAGMPIDIRTDIYALGATYYHMLAGEPPFYSSDMDVVINRRLTDVPDKISNFTPEVPKSIEKLIPKMLTPKIKKRISSPKELSNILENILEELEQKYF